MRKETIICDICEEVFQEKPKGIAIKIQDYPSDITMDYDDVCPICRAAIRGAIVDAVSSRKIK